MIEVTRLNGISMLVNSDLIKIAESSPDTMLTLISGEKLIIRESCAELLEKVMDYRAALLASVARRLSDDEAMGSDVHRMAALTSLNLEPGLSLVGVGVGSQAGPTGAGPTGASPAGAGLTAAGRGLSGLKLETSGR